MPLRASTFTAAGLLSSVPWALHRMNREFRTRGSLTPPTASWMYALYAAHADLYGQALLRRPLPVPIPKGIARVGWPMVAAGAALCGAGMGSFETPAQVSGTASGTFVTRGVYRLTRNPQYLGYLLLLGGGAFARRSACGLLLTAAAAATFSWWVPAEERHLTRLHGTEYQQYLNSTRRWIL